MKNIILSITIVCLLSFLGGCGERPVTATVGRPAPDFSLVDRAGKTWTLSELKGQVIFINFWATWCSPCVEEMPSMQRLFGRTPAKNFKMLAILNNDKPEFADSLMAKEKYTFPVLIDPENVAGKAYGLTGVPETYIVDKNGILREKFLGAVPWDSPGAQQMIMKYINE